MNDSSMYMWVILVGALIIWRRSRSMVKPIKGKGLRILLPLVFISFPVILIMGSPHVHVSFLQEAEAIGLGLLLAIPLIWTTNYEIREDQQIYTVKSRTFFVSFILVLLIRLALRDYLHWMTPEIKAALFLLLALGYILPWRVISYMKFRQLYQTRQVQP